MIDQTALLESRALRSSVLERTDVLDRVKTLALLPDGLHVTTAMVAAYFGVSVEAIRQIKARHREELCQNGMVTLQGRDLREFKRDILSRYSGSYPQPRSGLTVYSRRAVLDIAMLLRDSEVARRVRTYLLDMEHLGRTVVPMFNALIETSGEHRRELTALHGDVRRAEHRLRQHSARLRRLEGRR
ncbi:restriction endonuclease [Streptomyces sp. SID4985]|uniref:restriction endonuclease n=1 Tax=Streptomyces sp. SID4985 TaxID=2690292 RepID=UPI00136E654E|nr:restriction endonuclease [Streptomyces sp. SID4985]MYQ49058.1 restriction endonuclease [Streptomyces sp. SID4985]